MALNLNREQALAVNHPENGGELLVSAGAGSGKTQVMALRAKRLLADPALNIRADQLFVSTFTRAAAAELRKRIGDMLKEELQTASDAAYRQYLQKQRVYLDRAAICTVDSFCIQLVRQHFALLDIAPDFTLAEGPQLDRLEQQAVQKVVEEFLKKNPYFKQMAGIYGRSRSDGKMAELCLNLHNYLTASEDPAEQLKQYKEQWAKDVPIWETAWGFRLAETALETFEAASAVADRLAEEIRTFYDIWETVPPLGQMAEILLGDRALLKKVRDTLERACREKVLTQDDWMLVREAKSGARWPSLQEKSLLKMLSLTGDETLDLPKKAMAGQLVSQTKHWQQLRKDIWDEVKASQEPFQCQPKADREAANMAMAFLEAAEALEKELMDLKREEKKFSFADCEHLALNLLWKDGKRTALAEEISKGFATIMVDEYQDTNAIQEKIYRCIGKPDGSNLFFVGDIKQGIYRFRQADPTIFLSKLAYQKYRPDANCPQTLALPTNYRSDGQVIQGCNALFETIMSPALGGVDYKGDASQQLVQGSAENQGKFQVTALTLSLEEEEYGKPDAAHEAVWVAEKIKTMLDWQEQVKGRSVRPEDICLIFRSRKYFPEFVEALENRGIPAYANLEGNLLNSPVVAPLAALLRVLDNPNQDFYLAAALLSPLMGFQPKDLLAVRAARKGSGLYEALKKAAGSAGQGERETPLQEAVRLIQEWGQMAYLVPLAQLLEEIMAVTHYPAAVAARPDGESAQEELELFLEWAAGREACGLNDLIRLLDAAEMGKGLPISGSQKTRPGCVTLMTSHGSKGLQFPVVFVCDLAHKFNRMDEQTAVVLHDKLGVGITYQIEQEGKLCQLNSLAKVAIRQAVRKETISEEMRILYVALTRAEERLYLPVLCDDKKTAEVLSKADWWGLPWALAKADSWAGWIQAALPVLEQKNADWVAVETLPMPDPPAEQEEFPQLFTSQPDRQDLQLADGLQTRWAQEEQVQNRCRQLGKVPIKTSVTALAHKTFPDYLARPAFARKGEKLTGAERGTILHRAMEKLEYRWPLDLDQQLDRLVEQGIFTREEREGMEDTLQNFAVSESLRYISQAPKQYREYPFITSLEAARVMSSRDEVYRGTSCLVQGIVDMILEFEDHLEIWDWKTDRGKTPQQLKEAYSGQLRLYADAVGKRMAKPVTRCVLYSLALAQEVEIPYKKE